MIINTFAIESKNIKIDKAITTEKIIKQTIINQSQNGILPQNLVFNEKNKVFYALNSNNNSLDIIDYSDIKTFELIKSIDLSSYGKTAASIAYCENIIGIVIENQNIADSGKLVFFNADGEFIKAFSIAENVKTISFDQNAKKIIVTNNNMYGYKINLIDYSSGINNVSEADIKTYSYEKEKAGDAFVKLDPSGMGMTMVAMTVVFSALIFLYLVFKYIGKINTAQSKKKALLKQGKIEEASKISEDAPGEVYAAIAMALHLYRNQLHDEENTVLTMEKVSRTYSPWSSKIYGLRHFHNN